MKKKILICGASGFIGSNLTSYLSKKNSFKIYAVYFKSKPKDKVKKITYLKADLRKFNECIKITKNIDIVLQCAATTSGAKDIINKPYYHVTDNAVMNSYMLRACYENKIKHFIFTSCTVMYKHSSKPLSENSVDEAKIFNKYYGVANTKLYIEKMCKFYSNISSTKFSIIRHSNIYGPKDKFDIEKGHFVGSSIFKIYNNKKKEVNIFGMGKEKRDFLYISDLLRFFNILINDQKENFKVYNCTYGKSLAIREILDKLIKFSKKMKKIKYIRNAQNLNVNILVSSKKAYKELGWKPLVNLNQGLKKTLNWYLKNEKLLQK